MRVKSFMFHLVVMMLLCGSCWAESGLTFCVVADTHIGKNQGANNEAQNKAEIADLNALVGKRAPWNHMARIARPEGVLIVGDLTEDKPRNWQGYFSESKQSWRHGFNELFSVDGTGWLKYPIYEGFGNHDLAHGSGGETSLEQIRLRNLLRKTPINMSADGLHYSWDWNGIHFVNLNLYSGKGEHSYNSLAFLKEDLRTNLRHPKQPIILCHHYNHKWHTWPQRDRNRSWGFLKNYNVAAIFVGHMHKPSRYKWNGIHTYIVPKLATYGYLACYIKDGNLLVAMRKGGKWKKVWRTKFSY